MDAIGIIDLETGDIKIFNEPTQLYRHLTGIAGDLCPDKLLLSVNRVERTIYEPISAPTVQECDATDAQ